MLKIFIELTLSIHILLFISSWIVSGNWFLNKPAVKLNLARLLFVSCILSPFAVHCINQTEKLPVANFISLDSLKTYANQPILKSSNLAVSSTSSSLATLNTINYWQFCFAAFCIALIFRGYRFFKNTNKLKLILNSAISYRSSGKLIIKVSDRCHVPFSVRLFNKAYIVLPVSLLSSTKNIKIALAHEGQHHRNGDCLWAYFTEIIRIIFFCNPGVTRWHNTLSELQELACDEALVNHRMVSAHDYGHCLFEVAQTTNKFSQKEFACAVGMALNAKQETKFIIRRISMLENYQLKSSRRLILSAVFVTASIIAPLCTAYAAMGSLAGNATNEINTSFINPQIQAIATNEINAAVKQYHAKSGVIAIADPQTGKIIAFAQAGEVSGNNNWASRVFAPGSTIKPFVAAAAIDSGTSSPTQIYNCHSPYYVDGIKFSNYDSNQNSISLTDAVAQSNNICLIKVAQATNPAIFRKKLTEFGFDMNSAWQSDKSNALNLATAAIGETVPVTMETLTKAYAILANKGHSPSSQNNPIISEATANSVTNMLETVVTNGTGKAAAVKNIAVAGKTGTVANDSNTAHLALFSGYAPANAPHFVMVVVIENGYKTENGETVSSGGDLAAPVFHAVAIKSLNILSK